jgi:hypothetical protein
MDAVVIPEAPVLFSIAGISASMAGLAGLVAGLRRGADVRPMDLFRLREIVEFAFTNVLLALSTIPIAISAGSASDAFRIVAVAALAYIILHTFILIERSRRNALATSRGWLLVASGVNLAVLITGAAAIASGAAGPFEAMLLAMLARPMLAFLLVLASFEATA